MKSDFLLTTRLWESSNISKGNACPSSPVSQRSTMFVLFCVSIPLGAAEEMVSGVGGIPGSFRLILSYWTPVDVVAVHSWQKCQNGFGPADFRKGVHGSGQALGVLGVRTTRLDPGPCLCTCSNLKSKSV